MKPFLPGAALALLLAPAAAGAEPSAGEIARFITAVESVGCIVQTDAQAAAVEEVTGFSDAKLAEIVAVLLENGRAVVPASMEGLRLTTEGCS